MKKTPPPPAPPARSSASVWKIVALGSLVLNAGLLLWAGLTRSAPPAPVAPPAAAKPAAAILPGVARVRPSGPYAALGSFMAENNRIPDLGWSEPQFAAFQEGFRASYEGRGLPLDEDASRLRDEISRKVESMLAREQPDPVQDYFRTLRDKEGVQRTASDLHYRITEEGFGGQPQAADTVVISFAARLPDGGALPALTRTRVRMAVRDLLPGLAEGVQLLREGGKALIYLPPALAFSEATWPADIPRGMPLGFFVELHEIESAAR